MPGLGPSLSKRELVAKSQNTNLAPKGNPPPLGPLPPLVLRHSADICWARSFSISRPATCPAVQQRFRRRSEAGKRQAVVSRVFRVQWGSADSSHKHGLYVTLPVPEKMPHITGLFWARVLFTEMKGAVQKARKRRKVKLSLKT